MEQRHINNDSTAELPLLYVNVEILHTSAVKTGPFFGEIFPKTMFSALPHVVFNWVCVSDMSILLISVLQTAQLPNTLHFNPPLDRTQHPTSHNAYRDVAPIFYRCRL